MRKDKVVPIRRRSRSKKKSVNVEQQNTVIGAVFFGILLALLVF